MQSQHVELAVRNFEKELATNITTNPKAFFAYAKTKTKTKECYPNIHHNNTIAISDIDKAQCFNKFFASVFTIEVKTFIPTFSLNQSVTQLSDEIDLSPNNIKNYLAQLKIHKSPGPDGIHPRVLKETHHEISSSLSIIFHKILLNSTLPQIWKDAIVTPLFKKGDRTQASNYRPISLTCITVKIFEKIIKDHILSHLLKNNLLSPYQHGFRPGHSCVTNLITVIDSWTKALDEGIPVDNVYLDFTKAFDKVPHKRLLTKLAAYGINGKILSWIENFLNNRRQRVTVNGIYSDWVAVDSGVPQGSVLAALLFIIYVNDIPDEISPIAALFADDTKLYRLLSKIISHYHLQNDIDLLVDWAKKWGMSFNINKCSVLHLGHNNKSHTYSMYDPSTSRRVELKSTICERDLGVYIDSDLKFSHHTTTQVNKANRLVGMIRRCYTYLDAYSFRRLFISLVRPHLEYCGTVYNPRLVKDKRQIENVLRRASKMIPGLRDLPYEQRLARLKLPSMQYRLIRGDLIEVYKWFHSYYKCDSQLFKIENRVFTRGHAFKLRKSFCRLELRKHFFTMRIPNETAKRSSMCSLS